MLDETNSGYLKNILTKFAESEVSFNAQTLLRILKIINQEHLWSDGVKEHLILCIFHTLNKLNNMKHHYLR